MSKQGRFAAHIERLKTVPGLGRDVGALTVLMMLGVLSAVIIKSYLGGSAPWSDQTIVKAEFAQVPGLNPESQNSVTIAGVKVGAVTQTEATDDGTAVVTMRLDGNYDIYKNAQAVLRPKNPLNEMQLELNPGTKSAGRMTERDVLPVTQTKRPIQADEILGHLDERSQSALTDLLLESDVALARAPQNLPPGLGATSDTLDSLQPVVKELATRKERIATLVTALGDISQAVGSNDERITRLASSTEQTLSVLAGSDKALRASLKEVPGLTVQLRRALGSTQELTTQLDPTLDNLDKASKDLPPALTRFQSTIGNLGDTLDSAKPVLDQATGVIADLRPTVADAGTSLRTLRTVTGRLDHDTLTVMNYLTDINAFVYNTSSVFGAGDANGGIIRGHLMVPLPGAAVLPNKLDQGRGDN
ncbi:MULTISPECIES: MlaD family protein [unclassified Nocardioides]|uniref:MlaD family protein n=1 Tax=unclassified Nocardioides TaxID=2615069 RepID=UPI00070333A2|nr:MULTISPECIES: MlaD family protein [unclassified Nocardioides]KQZ68740.1 aromatic ring-opening dioxygenase LigA [Nocardioides sp. Root151]KRF11869.1 aromatic ring-opening dioxygenase LigA [Nocardioides sp. Soil796]